MTPTPKAPEKKTNRTSTPTTPSTASTEGRRLLREVDDPISRIARRLRVSKPLVGHWRTGLRVPMAAARRRLHKLYGIDPVAWTRPSWVADHARHLARTDKLVRSLAKHLRVPDTSLRAALERFGVHPNPTTDHELVELGEDLS